VQFVYLFATRKASTECDMKAELVQGQFSRLTARNTKADETKQEGLCRDS
jgi:hypothetical protein